MFLGKDKPADIVFGFGVADSQTDADIARSIAMNTVRKFPSSYQTYFAGVRMKNPRPATLLELTPTQKQGEIIEALRSSILTTSGNNYDLETSLNYITNNILRIGTGYRYEVPKTLILFVNKAPKDLVTSSKAVANLLRDNSNVKVVVVGVGKEITEAELLALVNGDKDTIKMVKDKKIPTTDDVLDLDSIARKGT